jgi:8-oxo-dGTP diphosphatase
MVTVDIMVLRYVNQQIEILLIQRRQDPFAGQWALPGGFVKMTERLQAAAERELAEETSLQKCPLFPLTYADHPERDPRGRTISFIFGGIISPPFTVLKAASDARSVDWYPVSNLPDLAFDHASVIEKCFQVVKLMLTTNYGLLAFLPHSFSTRDIESCYHTLYNTTEQLPVLISSALQKKLIRRDSENHFVKLVSGSDLYDHLIFSFPE